MPHCVSHPHLAVAALGLAACAPSFAVHANRPPRVAGVYQRTLDLARELGAGDMAAELVALGSSRDYNALTDHLLVCYQARVETLRWRRQTETGHAITREGLLARLQSHPDETDFVRHDVAELSEPATAWRASDFTCLTECGAVAHPQAGFVALPRDQALASKYLAQCSSERESARISEQRQVDESGIAEAAAQIAQAEQLAGRGCYLDASLALDDADRRLAHAPATDDVGPLRGQVGAVRARFAQGLALVRELDRDPQVVALRAERARAVHAWEVAHGSEVRDAQAAEDLGASDDPGGMLDAQDASEAAGAVRADLDDDVRRIDGALLTLARHHHVACPTPTADRP